AATRSGPSLEPGTDRRNGREARLDVAAGRSRGHGIGSRCVAPRPGVEDAEEVRSGDEVDHRPFRQSEQATHNLVWQIEARATTGFDGERHRAGDRGGSCDTARPVDRAARPAREQAVEWIEHDKPLAGGLECEVPPN